MLANLFNSLPAYMVHLPTMLFMLWPVLGAPALIYTGLTLAAAALRTLFTVGLGHFLLPPLHGENCIECRLPQEKVTLKSAALKAWKRFRRRLPKLVMFTIPVYVAMYLMQHYGLFRTAEAWLSDHTPWLGFIRPEALGIVMHACTLPSPKFGSPVNRPEPDRPIWPDTSKRELTHFELYMPLL